MNESHSVGDRLRYARAGWGWSQDELATASGVSVATVQRVEGGAYEPQLGTVRKLAEALRIRPDFLAFGNEPMVALFDMTGTGQVRVQSGPGSEGLPGFVVIGGGVWDVQDGKWRVVLEDGEGA